LYLEVVVTKLVDVNQNQTTPITLKEKKRR